ncbi:MAG: S8 family peptidase [Pelagimonas sp.]|uniref:S8 family peptidase n=1 Tax=Pelagimonas sp. TaxID=2073170 RepID=UPI003D6C2840
MYFQYVSATILAAFIYPGEVWSQNLPDEVSDLLKKSFEHTDGRMEYVAPNQELNTYLDSLGPDNGSLATSEFRESEVGQLLEAIEANRADEVVRYSIQVNPSISPEDASNAFGKYGLVPLDQASSFGIVSAGRLLPSGAPVIIGENTVAESNDLLNLLKHDPNFISVIEEPILSANEYFAPELAIGPLPISEGDEFATRHATLGENHFDWGLDNIKVTDLWNQPLALQGVSVGVLDIGFNTHLDLPLWGLDLSSKPRDHGNHVSGILCAKHDGRGINGVLPTCLVVPRTPQFSFLAEAEGVRANTMVAVLNAFEDIVENRDDIKAINVSLGYNWRENHDRIELTQEEKQQVADAAQQLLGLYQLAKERDIFIVTAAGNDSQGVDPKMNAIWSSPMNFASLVFCDRLSLCNGVVVEAHDPTDKHADFSNIGGDLSCPGVDVLSAVAHDIFREASMSDYAYMSGTSMASPYCAGGLVMLSMLRPNYSAPEIVACAKDAARPVTGAFVASALDLEASLAQCPPR